MPSFLIEILDSGHPSLSFGVFTEVNSRNHAAVANLRAVRYGVGNMGNQCALLCPHLAALDTKAAIDAMRPVAVRTGKNGDGAANADRNAQFGASLNKDVAARAHGMRTVGIAMRVAPGKIRGPGNGNFFFEQLVIGFQNLIRKRPVGSNTILCVNAKIRGMQPGRERRPVNRSAAHPLPAVVCAQGQRMLASGDPQIVPVKLVRSSFIADPIAFGIPERTGLQADDAETCAGEPLQQNTAGRTHSHDAVVHLLPLGVPLHWRL